MKTLFKIIKMLMAVVFGLFAFLFIAIWVTEPKKQEIEYAQQDINPQVKTIAPKQDAVQQQPEMKVKEKAAKPQEDPGTFMRRVANKGDKQISLGVKYLYIDIRSCPRIDCEIIETVQLPNRVDAILGTTTTEETEQGNKNWVKITYYGEVCKNNIDRKTGFCSRGYHTNREITGWVDFASLDKERPLTFRQIREYRHLYEKFISYRIFERNCAPTGIVVSDNIARRNEYYLNKYYNDRIKLETEEKVKEDINRKYSDVETYCASELSNYLNAQQLWLQNM